MNLCPAKKSSRVNDPFRGETLYHGPVLYSVGLTSLQAYELVQYNNIHLDQQSTHKHLFHMEIHLNTNMYYIHILLINCTHNMLSLI